MITSGLAPAEALASALTRAGLADADAPAAFRAVMAFVMGLAQAERAGPIAPEAAAAQRIGARSVPRPRTPSAATPPARRPRPA